MNSPQDTVRTAFVIGRSEGMQTAVDSLLPRAQQATFFHSLQQACQVASEPDLCLVLQHWPDEYSPQQVRELLSRFPLSRLIVCQGDWCGSYNRTHGFWPAAVCVSRDQIQRRIAREIDVFHGRRAPLPWTAGHDEIFAFNETDSRTP